MKKTLLLAALGVLALASSAFAGRDYGMAGCGLGSQWMGEDSIVKQVMAATTNGSSYNQLFGISSGSSNCTDDGVVKVSREAEMFIESNSLALANDIARGSGETVVHLSKVLGCSDALAVGATLQKNYEQIYSTENIKDSKVSGSILSVMKSSGQCARVI